MQYNSEYVKLKNGETIELCSPTLDDAQGCANHGNIVFEESPYLVSTPDDGKLTAEHEIPWLTKFIEAERDFLVLAKLNGQIIGLANLSEKSAKLRLRHRASFGISVQKAYWSVGVGSALLKKVIELSKLAGYEQIELQVMKKNIKAQGLYKKYGFIETGIVPRTLKYADGTYDDAISMVNFIKGEK